MQYLIILGTVVVVLLVVLIGSWVFNKLSDFTKGILMLAVVVSFVGAILYAVFFIKPSLNDFLESDHEPSYSDRYR